MKNNFAFAIVLSALLFTGLGCSLIGSSKSSEKPTTAKDKSLTDKAVDKTVGTTKIGVPECDEVMDAIELELNNSEDNFAVKAVKATFLNRIKDSIRESYEKNPNDKVELAKTCKEFKTQFDKYKAEEESKKKQ